MATTDDARTAVATRNDSSQAPAKKSNVQTVRDLLQANQAELAAALPQAGVTPQQLIRTAVTAMKQNPLLAKCTPQSIAGALTQAAHVGLLPGSTLGHAHLVPYWNKDIKAHEAQFQIGWQGLVQLARRSGQIDEVYADVIREEDHWKITRGLDRDLQHEPNYLSDDRGEVLFAYAVAKYPGGGRDWVVLDRKDLEKRKQMSQQGRKNQGPWKEHFEAMCRKSAIKALGPFLPLSLDDARAFATDGSVVSWDPAGGQDVVDVDPGDAEDIDAVEVEAGDVDPETGETTPPDADADAAQAELGGES